MNEQLLAQMIGRRKSVRSYTDEPLSPDVLADIGAFAEGVQPLFSGIKAAFRVLSRKEIACSCSLSAPHYLAFYSERGPDADLNCGFILQQVDLYLSAKGIGSCWLGMARPLEGRFDDLPFVILLSFGNPAEPMHRTSVGQFKRKRLDEISSVGAIPEYVNAMRLAPSAMNKQPWFFSGDARCCRFFSLRGKGFIGLADGWRLVDLGIALAHLYVMAIADGRAVSFRREDSIPAGNGSEYVISCRVSES